MSRDHRDRSKRIQSRYRSRVFRSVERLESRCVLSAAPLAHPVVAPVHDFDGYRDLRISSVDPGKDVGYADLGGPSHSADKPADTFVHSPRGPVDPGDISPDYLPPAQTTSEYAHPGLSAPNVATMQIVTLSPRIVNGSYVMDVAVVTVYSTGDNYASNLGNRPFENRPSISPAIEYGIAENPSAGDIEYAPSVSPHGNSHPGNELTGLAIAPRSTNSESSAVATAAPLAAATTSTASSTANVAAATFVAAATRPAPLLADRIAIHPSEQIDVTPPWALAVNAQSAAAIAAAQLADMSVMAGRFDRIMIGYTAGGSQSIEAAADVPMRKASLVAIPNLAAVEQALVTVVNEIEVLGKQLTHWLDDVRLTPMVVAITAAVAGAGATYYVRRRGANEADVLDEEASSSWLFARLQTVPR